LLANADFATAGDAGGAARWLAEGARGYTLVPTARHGPSGGSIRANTTARAQMAGAVQVFAAPAGGGGRLLRVAGWSSADAVSGAEDDDYAISCDLAFADGSHRYGVAVARFPTGTHDWARAEAAFRLPAAPALHAISFYLLFRGKHTGTAAFSDVGCWLDGGASPAPAPPPPPAVTQRWAIYSAYGEGGSDPTCPGGCPETNDFGVVANHTNVFFSPYLNLVTGIIPHHETFSTAIQPLYSSTKG
jgi:hypothetical protein